MRVNQYLASATDLSRRAADQAIRDGLVTIDNRPAKVGEAVPAAGQVSYRGQIVRPAQTLTIALHKPVGAICSRRQQGSSPTIYDLLPAELQLLVSIGRLDKDSSGLLIMTNNGQLNQRLSHPSHGKTKIYEVELDRTLTRIDRHQLEQGITLDDGPSHLEVQKQVGRRLTVALGEGRNRQIRRTFKQLGYTVTQLHRTAIGQLQLGELKVGKWRTLKPEELT